MDSLVVCGKRVKVGMPQRDVETFKEAKEKQEYVRVHAHLCVRISLSVIPTYSPDCEKSYDKGQRAVVDRRVVTSISTR